ncbi:MAG: methylaspartate mutase subunit E [Bacteroidota bacterium]
MSDKYQLLIGGIGDDAHSVGINLLALGFEEQGFNVLNLGIRNSIHSFFKHAPEFDIIMISNKNGHAELYLHNFAFLLSEYQLKDDRDKLWYLGGSLSVSESDFAIKKKFLTMGFTDVYPRTENFYRIVADIKRDIHRFNIPKKNKSKAICLSPSITLDALQELKDEPIPFEDLQIQRKEVIREWPTGERVELNEFYSSKNSLSDLLVQKRRNRGISLLQPRTGVADIERQITKLKTLEDNGSDISSVQLDAASRSKKYANAKLGIELSLDRGKSILNGFPIPIYGVDEVRRMVNTLRSPFQLRAGGPDHKFTYEIALSAGITSLEGGGICYLMPYDKNTAPITSIKNWQYIDRLCVLYQAHTGIPVNREYFGVLTASLIEPSIAIVVNILQAILAAKQGIINISLGYAEQGNRYQDIAAIQILQEKTRAYLNQFGYERFMLTTVFHQYMAAFPADTEKSEELIFESCITGNLAGATKIMVKTPVEAYKIPDTNDNVRALGICKNAGKAAMDIHLDFGRLELEKYYLRLQVDQLMKAVIELGNGEISKGMVRAIDQGILDITWSPNVHNKGQVFSIRDVNGAVRFMKFGQLPFSEEVKDFHLEQISQRKMLERDSSDFALLEKDLCRIWKNDYQRWPLDFHYVN